MEHIVLRQGGGTNDICTLFMIQQRDSIKTEVGKI